MAFEVYRISEYPDRLYVVGRDVSTTSPSIGAKGTSCTTACSRRASATSSAAAPWVPENEG